MMLSIIIVNYKQKNLVRQLLLGISKQNISFDFEVIVVDNNSKDCIDTVIDDIRDKVNNDYLSKIKIIELRKNIGMGAGNNRGVQRASGDYVLILNPDVVLLENAVSKLIDFAQIKPKAGIIAPALLNPDKTIQQSRYRFPKFYMPAVIRTFLGKFFQAEIKEYLMEDEPADIPQKVDWVRGSVMLIPRQIYEEVEGFDERYFMYMEDVDLCKKIWQAGYEVWYFPEAKVIHYYGKQSGKSGSWQWIKDLFKKMAWVHIISWVKYFLKWRNRHNL